MASSWASSWSESWGDSWGAVSTTTAVPAKRKYTYRPDLAPPEETPPLKPRKQKKIRVIQPKPSLLKLSPEKIEVKRDLLLEKIQGIGQELSEIQITKGDRVKYNLIAKRKRAELRVKEYQQALEYYFEMELQKKIKEKKIVVDVAYVMLIMSEL